MDMSRIRMDHCLLATGCTLYRVGVQAAKEMSVTCFASTALQIKCAGD